jgi:hypothetical protein
LSPSPKEYFLSIRNPIDDETNSKIKEIFQIVNNYHIGNKTNNFQKIEKIKIYMTFPFGIYIFL